jgi:DNA-binding transcriptional regulator YiaG
VARKKKVRKKTTGRKSGRGGRKPGKWEFVTPEAIRAHRAENALSRAKLANHLGVSTTSIQNWESGRPASLKIQRQLRDLMDGKSPAGPVVAGANGEPEASVIRTTGTIVAAYLQSSKAVLQPAQLSKLVRSVRAALRS